MSGRVAGWTHPLEKSATNLRNASIHRLLSQSMNLWRLRLPSAQKAILAPTPLENDFGEMEDYVVLCRRCNKIARE
jgi:hypothetical protein